MKPISVAIWADLADRKPAYALVGGVDLVVIRHDDRASVLYGRCLHRGALLADGFVDGNKSDLRRASLGLPDRQRHQRI